MSLNSTVFFICSVFGEKKIFGFSCKKELTPECFKKVRYEIFDNSVIYEMNNIGFFNIFELECKFFNV